MGEMHEPGRFPFSVNIIFDRQGRQHIPCPWKILGQAGKDKGGPGMKNSYGYVRVSTREQNESRQMLALGEAQVPAKNIYMDKQSGKDFGQEKAKKMLKVYIEAAKQRGVRFGRPQAPLPDNFGMVSRRWYQGEISGQEAARLCNMPTTSFYRKAGKRGEGG